MIHCWKKMGSSIHVEGLALANRATFLSDTGERKREWELLPRGLEMKRK